MTGTFICQNCGHSEYLGALFCSECGIHLHPEDGATTQSFKAQNGNILQDVDGEISPPKNTVADVAPVSLYLMDIEILIPLKSGHDFVMGRSHPGQQVDLDVDFAPHDGFECGVSRKHAKLKLQGNGQVFLTDLGSANGTRLNGKKMFPQRAYPVFHGDIVALGKLKLQVLIQKQNLIS